MATAKPAANLTIYFSTKFTWNILEKWYERNILCSHRVNLISTKMIFFLYCDLLKWTDEITVERTHPMHCIYMKFYDFSIVLIIFSHLWWRLNISTDDRSKFPDDVLMCWSVELLKLKNLKRNQKKKRAKPIDVWVHFFLLSEETPLIVVAFRWAFFFYPPTSNQHSFCDDYCTIMMASSVLNLYCAVGRSVGCSKPRRRKQ